MWTTCIWRWWPATRKEVSRWASLVFSHVGTDHALAGRLFLFSGSEIRLPEAIGGLGVAAMGSSEFAEHGNIS